MFDFSSGELLLIGIVALIVIGPKELPGVLRTAGQWMGKVRRMAGEFQSQFQDALREAELADLKKEVDDVAAQAARHSYFDPLDPLAEPRKDMDKAQQEVESALAGTPAATGKGSDVSAATAEGAEAAAAAAPQPRPEGAAAEGAAPHASAPAVPADEPKAAAEHAAGGSERG